MNLTDYAIDFRHPIGHGQFGSVYRGWSRRLGCWTAIKQVPLNQSPAKVHAEREGAKNQRKFARVYKGLIPEVIDDGVVGSAYWIAMELIEGEALSSMILKRSLSPVRSVGIAAGIANFLRKAHAINLFHSDLKPQHILIGPHDSVRVIDFGIMTEGEASSTSDTNPFASREYAAPERLLSGRISRSAEYWSLGVMLYEMLSGRHPYSQVRPNDLERAIIDGHRMAPLPDAIHPDLQAVVEKMLAHRVESRYTDAALAADLDNYLSGRPTTAGLAKLRTGATTIPVPPGRFDPKIIELGLASPERTLAAPNAVPAPTLVRPEVELFAPTQRTEAEPPAKSRPSFWRVAGTAALVTTALAIAGLVASEGAVWIRAAELARRIPAMESADVPAVRSDYANIRKLGLFAVGLRQVNDPLRERMLALAERPITDYRSDKPVGDAQWRQAAVCIALADDLSPGNARVQSARRLIEGHLQWARAGTPAEFQTAVGMFRAAAALDPASVDPYLGLAHLHAYNVKDVAALAADIRNAEARGYTPGQRERTQLEDAVRMRTAGVRRTAATTTSR